MFRLKDGNGFLIFVSLGSGQLELAKIQSCVSVCNTGAGTSSWRQVIISAHIGWRGGGGFVGAVSDI